MDKNISEAVERYQCSGCVAGYNTSCFEKKSRCGGSWLWKAFSRNYDNFYRNYFYWSS